MIYIVVFIILILVLVLVLKWPKRKIQEVTEEKEEEKPYQIDASCCGAHEVCEFDESMFNNEEIIYFNDEELDQLRNVREEEFTGAQIEDLREVLYTLRTDEISKWLTSISRRHIHLPQILQQEARQLMAEN
ncbi:MAG: hypothetical protein WAO52_16210 [Prolixibacteraceae bacterium]